VVELTGLVATEDVVAEATPAGTVTEAGTVAAAVLLLVNATRAPPAGAGAVSVTVAELVPPPCRVAGLRLTELRAATVTVHPESRALVGVAEPSFTSTVQSAGGVNPDRSILKAPELSLVPIWTPSTVIGRLAVAVPSIRSRSPLTSARETLTAAWAVPARATDIAAVKDTNTNASRLRRPVMAASWHSVTNVTTEPPQYRSGPPTSTPDCSPAAIRAP